MKPLCLFLLLAPFLAPGQVRQMTAKAAAEPTVNIWPRVQDSSYTIDYPPDWELNKSGALGTDFFLFAPRESAVDSFRENINLLIEELPEPAMALDDYVAYSVEQGKAFITDLNLLASNPGEDGHGSYHQLVFTGRQGVFRLKWIQHYRIVEQKAYVLTATCQQSRYPYYRELVERIMASFAVLK